MQKITVAPTNSSPPSTGTIFRRTDVVKKGCLYVKRPPSFNPVKLRIKTWQKRYLVLRDTWTHEGMAGVTTLELYANEAEAGILHSNGTSTSVNSANTAKNKHSTVNNNNSLDGSCKSSRTTGSSQKQTNRLTWTYSSATDQYFINLRNVTYVGAYTDSHSFPNAFIVFRSGKSPLIFGAKTDLEMREWMMAIKLMADKANCDKEQPEKGPECRSGPGVPPLTKERELSGSSTQLSRASDGDFPPCLEGRQTIRRDDAAHRSTPQLLSSSPNGAPLKMLQLPQQMSLAEHNSELVNQQLFSTESKFLVSIARSCSDGTDPGKLPEGDYYLMVNEKEISLRTRRDKELCISWLLMHIRKLKSESMANGKGDVVTLEASSQCGSSQGTYKFHTKSGWELIQCVRELARKSDNVSVVKGSQQIQPNKCTASQMKSFNSASVDELLQQSNQDLNQSTQSLDTSSSNSSQSNLLSDNSTATPVGSSISASTKMRCLAVSVAATENSYLPVVEDYQMGSTSSGTLSPPIITRRSNNNTLSRSTGSLGLLAVHTKRNDSGFESCEEAGHRQPSPPKPPPRPLYTISTNDIRVP